MSTHYSDEWAERMHSALMASEAAAGELKKMNKIADAMFSASNDINSAEALRTVVRALANEILGELRYADDIEEAVEYGLQVPEAEQAEEE